MIIITVDTLEDFIIAGQRYSACIISFAAATAGASAAAMSSSGIGDIQASFDEQNSDDWFEFGDNEDEDQMEMVQI